MRLTGQVELTGGRTGTYRVWREDLTERDPLARPRRRRDDNIKMDVQELR